MATYHTQFSCLLDVGSADNAATALALLDDLRDDPAEDEPPYGFEAVLSPSHPGTLLITDGGGEGDPEHVIAFVLACAEALGLTGRWGFTWALTCSRQRLDGFGGGAQLLDLDAQRSLAWLDCEHWLKAALDPAFDAETGVAGSAANGGEPAMGKGEPIMEGVAAADRTNPAP